MMTSSPLTVFLVTAILLPAMPLLSLAQSMKVKDFAAENLLVDSGATGQAGTTSLTGWTGKLAIDKQGRISGTIAARSWANNANRSTLRNYMVKADASKVFAPVAKVLRNKETNSYSWGRDIITTDWYEADFILRTTQTGVVAKGRARLEVEQQVTINNEVSGGPSRSTNNSRYVRLSGGLFGLAGQVGEFYAGN